MNTKIPISALSCFNFCLYGTRALLAGHIYNSLVEGDNSGNEMSVVTPTFLLMTFISCMIGGAASFFGFIHFREWTEASRMVAIGMGLMGCFMDFLTSGFAGKQWERGADDGYFGDDEDLEGRLHFMGVATVVVAFTMMLYVGVLLMPLEKKEEADVGEMTDEHHEDENIEKNSA